MRRLYIHLLLRIPVWICFSIYYVQYFKFQLNYFAFYFIKPLKETKNPNPNIIRVFNHCKILNTKNTLLWDVTYINNCFILLIILSTHEHIKNVLLCTLFSTYFMIPKCFLLFFATY